jgi:hypothetical protein
MSQLSLFSAAAREPRLTDLEGLLAGPGQVVRRGDAARISVVLVDPWRFAALTAEMATLGLDVELDDPSADDAAIAGGAVTGVAVRTPWLQQLRSVADGWTRGAVKVPPPGWELDGARLRWWCLAAGAAGPAMYTLALGDNDEPAWPAVGASLAAAGVPGLLVGPRADGPAYRVVGQRRLRRLRELVGDAPPDAPADGWPPDDYARGA